MNIKTRPRKPSGFEASLDGKTWVKYLPMTFTAENAQKVVDGTKTQTRRIIGLPFTSKAPRCPIGTICWIREPWLTTGDIYDGLRPTLLPDVSVRYEGEIRTSSEGLGAASGKLRPARFMPQRFSRCNVVITDVRLQRVKEISREDVIAEGVELLPPSSFSMADTEARDRFKILWDSIHGKKPSESFSDNPYVFAYTFRKL